MEIGIIGLGLAGRAVAGRLLAQGYQVIGYDIAPEACAAARAQGAQVVALESLAEGRRVLLLCLLTSEQRREVLWGAQALAAKLAPGAVLLDVTTGRPQDTREDAARLAAGGKRLVDVCLIGSSEEIEAGEAVALIGAEADFGAAAIVAALTRAQQYLGRVGRGTEAKLITNLVLGLHRLVLAEGLGLAAKAGFDLEAMLELLKSGAAYSRVMDTKGPKMCAGVYEPAAARLAQHAKDVDLILEYGAGLGAALPLSTLHAELLRDLLAAGLGDLDNAAIADAFRRKDKEDQGCKE